MIDPTPDQICAAYRFLRTLPPFSGWNLPHESYVEFRVVLDPKLHGWHKMDGDVPIIAISEKSLGHVNSMIFYMAHEMIHLAQSVNKTATRSIHNRDFRERAKIVCERLGFDYRVFV